MGPFLFNIFINDLKKAMEHTVINTADGTKLAGGGGWGNSQYVQWQSCHSERPRQTGGRGQQGLCEIEQGQVPSPALRMEEFLK